MKVLDIQLLEQAVKVIPVIKLYSMRDFMGKDLPGLAIQLYTVDPHHETLPQEPFALLTVNFGEFIGVKNAAYIDTNNCPFADQILKTGIAVDTGLTKRSGFCTYPLWVFDENFLKEHGAENYSYYSKKYDEYMENVFDDLSDDGESVEGPDAGITMQ